MRASLVTEDLIRAAVEDTPKNKATAYDSVNPKQIAMLDSVGIQALAIIWECIERTQKVSRATEEIMAPLIPKKDGNERDLALFAGVYRICMKARQNVTRKWEEQHEKAFIANGEGRGCTDIPWLRSLEAEAATAEGQTFVQITHDMEAFFQQIDHNRLVEAARKHDFPEQIVRAAIAYYRKPRRMYNRVAVAEKGLKPTKSIAPGCPIATTLVKLY